MQNFHVSPISDEGFSDIFSLMATLDKLTEREKTDVAFHLLRSVSTKQRSDTISKLQRLLKRDFISDLPLELSIYILSLADTKTALSASQVSKTWNAVASDPVLWKFFYLDRGWFINMDKIKFWKFEQKAQGIKSQRSSFAGYSSSDSSSVLLKKLGSSLMSLEKIRSKEDDIDWKFIYKNRQKLENNWNDFTYETKELKGHEDCVYAFQFDSRKIITGSRDATVRVWNAKTCECEKVLKSHEKSVLCLQFDDRYLVTGSSDSVIIIWNVETFDILRTIKGHEDSVLSVAFEGDRLVSASKDRTIKMWDIQTGECLRTIDGHHAAVNSVLIRGNRIYTASGDRTIKLWDVTTGKCVQTLIGHARGIASLSLVDGQTLCSGSSDKSIRVWNMETGKCERVILYHSDLVRSIHCHENILVSGSYDKSVKIIERETGKLLLDVPNAHPQRIYKVMAGPTKIISCGQDQTVIIWDFAKGVECCRLFQHD